MCNSFLTLRRLVIFSCAQFFCLLVFAQDDNVDSMLVSREKQKWEALATGEPNPAAKDWFAKDMHSIGYMPDGTVYRTLYNSEKQSFTKSKDSLAEVKLPKATFVLSDFTVISPTADVKIVTYQSDGPIHLYATTVWHRRNDKWESIFYQATKYK